MVRREFLKKIFALVTENIKIYKKLFPFDAIVKGNLS